MQTVASFPKLFFQRTLRNNPKVRLLDEGSYMSRECDAKVTARGPKGAWTHILIPFDAAEAFGRRGLIPVTGTINGHAFRSSLTPEGEGRHYLMANKAMLAGAKAAAGDVVQLVLALDTAERTVTMPAELEAALKGTRAGEVFAGLAYSCRKEYAVWIDGAKKQETRASRAQKAVAMLLEGKRTPH